MTNKKQYMDLANELAQKAFKLNEVPIGCIITKDNQVIGSGFNSREKNGDVFGHAEINAIKDASSFLDTWKLDDCQLYVTVEPCLMCYGAIKQSRINKVYIGSIPDHIKKSSYRNYIKEDSIIDLSLLNDQSSDLMKAFFKNMRS